MSIRLLPDDVISQIKSSITITSLNGVVEELLKNSLDAGAAHVGISIDYARANCSVEDDGLGIRPEEFLENGGLCKLHCKDVVPISEFSQRLSRQTLQNIHRAKTSMGREESIWRPSEPCLC